MATIFDPQNFSTSFLTGSVNDYNSLTDEQRSQYTDMTNFTPLQTDPANFSTTMQDPGFVKYMTAPVAKAAKGPTVTIQGTPSTTKVPSAEELMARMEAGQPMIRQGEELPTYDPRSGESPGEFWSQYPSFAYAGEGLRGTIYGLSNSQLQEIEEAPNVQATPVQQQRQTGRSLFQPGGHPGTPEGSLAASKDRINKMSLEGLMIHNQMTDLLGLPRSKDVQHRSLIEAYADFDRDAFSRTTPDPDTGKSITSRRAGFRGSRGASSDGDGSDAGPAVSPNAGGTIGGPGPSGGQAGGGSSTSGGSAASTGTGVSPWCWVARKVYGEDNPKWKLFRAWLFTQAPKWLYKAYGKYGERFAEWLDGKPILQKIIRKWMDKRIEKYLNTQPKTAQEIGPC